MYQHKSTFLELDFDLAFSSASNELLEDLNDLSVIDRLTKVDLWLKDLKNWIQVIRHNPNWSCPDIVRKTSALSMGLQLTDDLTIKQLNATWRKKDETTDVLAFPALDESVVFLKDQCIELGDIVVSVPVAQDQAKNFGYEFNTELRWLVSHGLLHLLGWDHPNPIALDEMLLCQKQLLKISDNVHGCGDRIKEHKNAS